MAGNGRMQVGIGVSVDLPVRTQQDLAVAVEEAGFVSLWTNEASGRDALVLCTSWADVTERLELGVGVAPIWSRSPAQLAMAAATLNELSGGRFVLGLGVSHPATMDTWHGASYRRPLTAARETFAIIRTALDGRSTDLQGQVMSSRRFSLGLGEIPPSRLYLAAMGERMLATAGELADGVLLNWSSPAEVARAVGTFRSAAARTDGRGPAGPDVAGYVRVAVDEDRDAARLALAREISTYCALPAYAEHFSRQGFGRDVDAVKQAYRDGGADAAARAVPERMVNELGWYGTPDESATTCFARYSRAGMQQLVARVVVVGDDPETSIRRTVDALRDEPFAVNAVDDR